MKAYLIVSILMLCSMVGFGQDVMYKVDGEQVEVKVLEVTPSDVKYKLKANLDGPDYVLPKSDIYMLEYANGMKEVFGAYSIENEQGETDKRKAQQKSPKRKMDDKLLFKWQEAWGVTGVVVGGTGIVACSFIMNSEVKKYRELENRSILHIIGTGVGTLLSISVAIGGIDSLWKASKTKSRLIESESTLMINPRLIDVRSYDGCITYNQQAYGISLSCRF
jgi:hypothetical protein